MENLEIKVSRKTRMVELPKQFISVEGENLQSKLVFSFYDEFVDGQARLEYKTKGEKNYIVLTKENDTYTLPVKNVLTVEGQIDMQLVITEGTNEEDIPVFKSNMFYLFCNSSVNAVDEAPEGYELWIEKANTKLNEVDNVDIDIQTIEDTTKVIITKKDGTTKEATVTGGSGTITNVLVDGKSVVDGGVAIVDLSNKQDVLVSSVNIKTINGQDILGEGNVDIKSEIPSYEELNNLPKINNITLRDNKTLDELGIQPKGEYALKSELPTKTSQLTNDSGFLTEHQDLNDYALKSEIPDVSNYALKSEIPDTSNFITKNVDDLNNYYNKNNIDEMIGNIEDLLGGI